MKTKHTLRFLLRVHSELKKTRIHVNRSDIIRNRTYTLPLLHNHPYGTVQQGLTSHSTHYTSFRRRFYGSDDPTNSTIAR